MSLFMNKPSAPMLVEKGQKTPLIIKATGADPDSFKRFMFGLDFLRLAPSR